MADKSHERRQVLKWAKATNRTLALGSLAVIAVIATRILRNGDNVEIWELGELPLKAAWLVFLGWTAVHAFTARFFRSSIAKLRATGTTDEQKAAWDDVVDQGGHFVGVTNRRLPEPGKRFVIMSWEDPSTWIAHAGALGLFVAMLPWWWEGSLRWASSGRTAAIASISLLIVIANWLIGGGWAIQLSTLGVPIERDASDHSGESDLGFTSIGSPFSGGLKTAPIALTAAGAIAFVLVPILAGGLWALGRWLLA